MGETALSVMCVDDDPSTLGVLRAAIDQQEHLDLVATTADAREVTALLRQHHPDVLVLDHRLAPPPAGDHRPVGLSIPQTGLELVEAARGIVRDLIIVIFTAQEGLETAAGRVGADAYVEKPNIDALWPAIAAARERRQDPNVRIDLRHDEATTHSDSDGRPSP